MFTVKNTLLFSYGLQVEGLIQTKVTLQSRGPTVSFLTSMSNYMAVCCLTSKLIRDKSVWLFFNRIFFYDFKPYSRST